MIKKRKDAFLSILFCFCLITTCKGELAGYWKLNEGTGTTAGDSSGKNNPGTITGAAWFDDAVMGKVLDFEGIDYITIPSVAFASINSKITIAFWQFGDTALQPQNNSVFYGANSSGTRVLNANLPWSNSNVYWDAGYSGTVYDRISKTAVPTEYKGQWNHWAFTKNVTAGEMKIYINGQLWTSATGKTKSMSDITQFKIGANVNGADNYDGMICEFRLYDEVLSENQIRALAGGQYVSTNPNPVDRAFDVDPYPTLTWKPGPMAMEHDIYIGTDADLVAARDNSIYAGTQDSNSFSPAILRIATTYYWAVDDRNDFEQGSPWKGKVWKFTTRHSSTEGFYKDLFIHAGVGLTGNQAKNIPATSMLGLSCEHIDVDEDVNPDATTINNKIMVKINEGSWIDDNGVLLYPDNEPRFRCMYVNGGLSSTAGNALGEQGRQRVRNFYFNGGGYTGSCAGSFLCTSAKDFHFKLYPKVSLDTGSGIDIYTDMFVPDGVTPFDTAKFGNNNVFDRSRLLDYYPQYFSDLKIHGIWHWNGNAVVWAPEGQENAYWAKGTEILCVYDFRWFKKDGVVTDQSAKNFHNKVAAWAYKRDARSGRLCPCGSHPEAKQTYGEEKYLQAAFYQYAMSGRGTPVAKGKLNEGVTRIMNNNMQPGYEKIGDMQYHHFTFEVLPNSKKLEITLDGNLYDMNLYAKFGDFAFNNERDVFQATNGTSSDETLVIDNPKVGTWYIGVKCNQKVANTYGGAYYEYTGRYELLNGLPYSITAATGRIIEGDIDNDGTVNNADLKVLADNWLIDNEYSRRIGEVVGRWDFVCEDLNNITDYAKDSSGYGNTVAFYGDANWADQGIYFDGADDYLQTADSNNLQLKDGYTIAFRINAASAQTEDCGIITKCGIEKPIPLNHWGINFGSGSSAGKLMIWNGMIKKDSGIELSKIANNWHDIVIVWGGGFMTSYLDGQKVKCEVFDPIPVIGQGHLNIGCDRYGVRFYKGYIDDVIIFNYELTQEEMEKLSEASSFGKAAGKWMFSDGTALDSSGNDNHGTLISNAAIIEDQQRGNVLSLDGEGYLSLPAEAFADVNDQVTISLWQYGSANQPKDDYIFYATNNYGKVLSANLPWSDGIVYFDAGNSIGGLYDRITKTASNSDDYKGKWNHWVFTKDASQGRMAIYLNGQLWHSGLGNTKLMSGINQFSIGKPSMSYDGLIDDFCVYNYCMSDDQVRSIYESGIINKFICPMNPGGDLNQDCKTDVMDFVKLSVNWLK